MNREHILEILEQTGRLRELECVGVKYLFDFNLRPHLVHSKTLYEIGRNDVDIPIILEVETRHVYFLDPRGLSFINSSFSQLVESFSAVNDWEIPDDLPDSERARLFSERMLKIDAKCFDDPEACWSTMREEIGYGVI